MSGAGGAPGADRATATATLFVLGVAAVVVLLLWPTFQSLAVQWTHTENRTYTHGFLVAAISLWLLVRTAREAPPLRAAPDWRVAIVVAGLSLVWLIVYRAGIELAHQVLMPVLALGVICCALGVRIGLRFWFACAYLYFAISIWDFGNGLLQSISVHAVDLLLAVTGIPAFVEGDIVNIPAGVFQVAGGCSGLHFFIVAFALAALTGELHHDPLLLRLRTVLLAVSLAMIGNWIRIYFVILAGHLTDMQHHLVRVEHYYFGWVIFALLMAFFFWYVSRTPLQPRAMTAAPPTVVPLPRWLAGLSTACIALSVGPALGLATLRDAEVTPQAALLPASPPWAGPGTVSGRWNPSFPHADRARLGTYSRDGKFVAAFAAEYDSQWQGKELVGYDNSLLAGLDAATERAETVHSERGPIRVLHLSSAGDARYVLSYYYEVGTRRLVSPLRTQLAFGLASLAGPVQSRVLAVQSRCEDDNACDAAAARTRGMLDALGSAREGTSP